MPQILAVGTAVPATSYSQKEILEIFCVNDRRVRALFNNSGIERRYLALPKVNSNQTLEHESQRELLSKHASVGLSIAEKSIEVCLRRANATVKDVRHLCCVSSTGFTVPGFSAHLIKKLGVSRSCSRLDVVGMGCNAGLNALAAVSAWAKTHPGELALLVCIEICSAMYVTDTSMETAVVNSLFGDGAATVAVLNSPSSQWHHPKLISFASHIVPEAIDALRVDWSDVHNKFQFKLEPEVPYVIGANAEFPIGQLLGKMGLGRSDVKHWVIHAGGRKVVDAVRINLGLTRNDLRHTLGVLRRYGNLSSASFLFSFDSLLEEGSTAPGDYGVFMTMGPGATIETCLLRW